MPLPQALSPPQDPIERPKALVRWFELQVRGNLRANRIMAKGNQLPRGMAGARYPVPAVQRNCLKQPLKVGEPVFTMYLRSAAEGQCNQAYLLLYTTIAPR